MTTDFGSKPYYWTREHLDHVICYSKSKILEKQEHTDAFSQIDRKDFIPEEEKEFAYMDREISIGFAQKMLKPTTIAQLIKLLNPEPKGRYLLIGGGSGYVASILGMIASDDGKVIVLERVLFLVDQMRENLKKYSALEKIVEPVFKDGKYGYAQEGPFDGILSCAYFEQIPEILIKQVNFNANIVCPYKDNEIRVITRVDKTNIVEKIYKGYIFDKIQEGVE